MPDLHHMRLELEEAATPEGHAVRFGFNPLEFENFSWRGYAHMTAIQVDRAAPPPPGRGAEVEADGTLGVPAEQAAPGSGDPGQYWVRGVTLLSYTTAAPDRGQAERDLP